MSDETEWVLVPREASSEMLTAAIDAHLGFEGEDEVDAVWTAMISAAEQFGATAGHAAQDVGDGAEGGLRAPTRPAHFPDMFPRQDDPASSSLSQPPAEAQPVLERIASRLRAAGASLPAPQVTGTVDGAVITGLSIALALVEAESGSPPPSAPVGVEGRAREAVALALDETGHHTEANNVRKGIDLDEYRVELSAARIALAQQPAAGVGEEIMFNAAHDVYTLPLQPSGLSSGPRFVVHVPQTEEQQPDARGVVDDALDRMRQAPPHLWRADLIGQQISVERMRDILAFALAQQPAAHPAITHCDNCGCDWLDNGLNPIGCPYCKQNTWRSAFIEERAARYREGGMAIEQARIHGETDAARMAVLAAAQQQGGGTDE